MGKIAKGLLCAFLFVLLSVSLLAGICAADNPKEITFVGDGGNRTITINYDEVGYFSSNASEYNLGLAQASLAMAAAAFAPESEHYAGTDEAAKEYRCQYLKSAYKKLGFNESEMSFYNYDKPLNSTDDKVAYGIANKTISLNDEDWTLFAVQVRGGGYAGEWTSNLHIDPYKIGDTDYSIGFGKPAKEIYNTLNQRISSILPDNGTKKVKIWISGFSRAAAVSNVLAGELTKHAEELGLEKENIYAYTFATPNAVLINPDEDVEKDYKNIHNTLNPCDIVPVVPMSVSSFGWNYSKYGTTHYYNYTGFTSEDHSKITNKYKELTKSEYNPYEPKSDAAFLPIVFELCLGKTITPEDYTLGFYPYVGEMISLAFCGNKANVTRLLKLNENLILLHPDDPDLEAAYKETEEYSEENEELEDDLSLFLLTRVVEIIQLFLGNANDANSDNNGPLREFVDGTVTIGFYKKLSWDDSAEFLNTAEELADTLIAAITALKGSEYDINNVLTITMEHHPEVYMSVLFSGIEKNLFMEPLDPDKLHAIIYETKGGEMEDGKYIEVYDITKSQSPVDLSTKIPTKEDDCKFIEWIDKDNRPVTTVDISKPGYTHLTALWTVSRTADGSTALFEDENKTILKDPSKAFVDSVLLNEVRGVVNGTKVTFTADNNTVEEIPGIDGYSKKEITVFEIDALVDETLAPATFTMTVAFKNKAAAKANMDNVKFWHYDNTTGWGKTPLKIKGMKQNGKSVSYTVETESFSPFGIGIYTPIPQPEPSRSSSRDYGASIWLTATPTPTPIQTPTAEPTPVQPSAQPIPTKQPATPVPFAGVIAGLSAAAVLFGLRRR